MNPSTSHASPQPETFQSQKIGCEPQCLEKLMILILMMDFARSRQKKQSWRGRNAAGFSNSSLTTARLKRIQDAYQPSYQVGAAVTLVYILLPYRVGVAVMQDACPPPYQVGAAATLVLILLPYQVGVAVIQSASPLPYRVGAVETP